MQLFKEKWEGPRVCLQLIVSPPQVNEHENSGTKVCCHGNREHFEDLVHRSSLTDG